MISSKASRLAFVASLLLAKLLVAPEPLAASTLTVTNLGDSGAPGQLRTLMNLAAPGDTIVIPAGTITLTGTVGENANVGGDLDIVKPLTIQGAGPGTTIIDGGGIERVMTILTSAGSVTISNLTIRNGKDTFGAGIFIGSGNTVALTNLTISGNTAQGSSAGGGGIVNVGSNVTLTNVTISGNSAAGAGGGIYNLSGGLTLTNVTISNNTSTGASGGGGGIFNVATVTMTNVTITGNSAPVGGGILNASTSAVATVTMNGGTISGNTATGAAGGGGISNLGGILTLTNVTLSGNTASAAGGIDTATVPGFHATATLTNVTLSGNTASGSLGAAGIRNAPSSTFTMTGGTLSGNTASGGAGGGITNNGDATLRNVTLSGNTATGATGGGGIQNGGGGTITLTNVTISNNTVVGSIGVSTPGGGINNLGSGATATLKNVLLSGNTIPGSARNCFNSATFTSLGNNLDSGTTCNFAGPGDLSNTNPQLGPLQNNGGPTQTHALLPGSPVINAGANSGCPSTDQRGFSRPQGTTCDIGAFEFGVIVAAVALNGSAFHAGQQITYQATLNPGLTPTQVDIYLGALLPDQATFLSLVQLSPGVISVVLGPSPVPFQSNVTLAPLAVPFNFTFSGAEPVGTYFPFAGLAVAGSNPFLPANQLSLGVQSFQFSP